MKDMHTPGPWRLSKFGLLDDGEIVITGDSGRIGTADFRADTDGLKKYELQEIDDPERDANARLIAAAPCLLGACKLAKHLLSEPLDEDIDPGGATAAKRGVLMSLKRAIAQATGKD